MGTLVVSLESIASDQASLTLGYRMAATLGTGLGLVLTNGSRSLIDTGSPELPAGKPVETYVLDSPPGSDLLGWVEGLAQPVIVLETPARSVSGENLAEWLSRNTAPATSTLVGHDGPADLVLQRLLVPLDGRPEAEQILPLANAIARTTGASIGLIRIIPPDLTCDSCVQAKRDAARAYLDAVARTLRADGAQVTWEVRIGDAGEEIARAAETTAANLILMASSHYGGIRSVAAATVGATSLPVIVTRVGG